MQSETNTDETESHMDADEGELPQTLDMFSNRLETGIEYQKFARALERLQRYRKDTAEYLDITSILPEFENLCSTRSQQFEHRKDADAQYHTFGSADEHKLWQSESHTWLLLSTLFSAFEYNKGFDEKGPEAMKWSDHDLIEHLASTDSNFKHHSAVKVWLQIIAPQFTPLIRKKERTRPPPPPVFAFNTTASITTPTPQDPDANSREGVKPSDNNQRIEHDLLQTVWQYIRRGQLQKAKDACIKAGEPWRAESIGGGDLYTVSIAFTDPLYDREEGPIGNKTRGLWKGTCYALSKEKTVNQFERAVYGALCGDVASVTPVCSSWEDHAWAQYNALVESMIETRLSQFNRGGPSKALPLPTTKISSAKDIFDSLANGESEDLRNASKDLFRFIQTSIILGQTDQLLSKMTKDAETSGKSGASLRPHMLRFMAHFVLLLRSKGINVPKAEGDYFITKYVEFLISRKLYELAPLYASFLPVDLQVSTCTSYLKTIDGSKKDRQQYLTVIRRNRLDLHRILMATVDALLDVNRTDFEKPEDYQAGLRKSIWAPITNQEKAHIRAFEWLSFDVPQYEDCLHRSNYLTRKYLIQGRLNAASALYRSLPSDIVQHEVHQVTPVSVSITHEHLYYCDLFKARELFEDWREVLLAQPAEDAPQTDRSAWKARLEEKAQLTIVEMESLLRSRWLFDCILPGDTVRNMEMRRIRQIYVSELVMNLHQVYFESRVVVPEYLEKSVEMANLVAAEAAAVPLYKELQENKRLQEFLELVRLSSVELVKEGRSPFAF
ncbi:Nucleoporin nup84 [Mortierella polycephala]|uniref:Nuclear pore complex protein n=1 Tax=Mortierella polycephala TaxID=41804 RepID=A0A9P6QEW2_9FUNG|nr:Nucleoporin nup84 [Mortierella polycephala]